MSDKRKAEQSPDQVEDLDVPAEERDDVKGGITDGTSNTVMFGEIVKKPSGDARIKG